MDDRPAPGDHHVSSDEGPPRPDVSALRRRIGRETLFLRRAARHPALVRRRLRRTLSPKVAYVERNHDPSRSLLVVGSARSGTTWLAEILSAALHARLVFEPLHNEYVPLARPVRFGQYLDPDADADPAVAGALDRILAGRVRARWTDEYNTVRFPRSRLIKEIRATNLLPWLVRRYPRTPVVLLLRHPVPSARSLAALDWPDRLGQFLSQEPLLGGPLAGFAALIAEAAQAPDPFLRFVLRWCLENYVPTEMLDPGRVHVVFYEQLVTDPRRQLLRLSQYLEPYGDLERQGGGDGTGLWDIDPASAEDMHRPSRTNYLGTDVAGASDRLGLWLDEGPAAQIDAALALVGGFGLDRLYARSADPLVAPDAVLRGQPPTPKSG